MADSGGFFGRPFDAVRANDGVSRRYECIFYGSREARICSERSGGVVLELFSEVGCFWKIFQSDTLFWLLPRADANTITPAVTAVTVAKSTVVNARTIRAVSDRFSPAERVSRSPDPRPPRALPALRVQIALNLQRQAVNSWRCFVQVLPR